MVKLGIMVMVESHHLDLILHTHKKDQTQFKFLHQAQQYIICSQTLALLLIKLTTSVMVLV